MTERKNFLVYGRPDIRDREIREVEKVLRSGWIGTGPYVSRFEEAFRKYKNSKYAVAVNSCTAALHLSILSLNLPANSEIITTPMTFCATANAIIHAGCVPVFADCRKDTMNLNPEEVKKKITKRTGAILPVHFAGRPCEMEELTCLAGKNNLAIIEDCAHAIETEYRGKKAGTFGISGCFSFYVTKNVVTGEGGMVITGKEEYAGRIKRLALHGMTKDAWKRFSDEGFKHYQVVESGYKYNMTDLAAALGIHQLARVEKNLEKRKRIWNKYNQAFENLPCLLPRPPEKQTRHSYHLYTLLLQLEQLKIGRDEVLEELSKRKIGAGVHYRALHLQPFYSKKYGYRVGDFPQAEWISERTISLPLSPGLTGRDVRDVIETVTDILKSNQK